VPETATLARIEVLHTIGVLDANARESLTRAFHLITGILLQQQIRDFKADRKVSYYVDPEGLSKRVRADVVDALKAIDSLRHHVRSEFTGMVF